MGIHYGYLYQNRTTVSVSPPVGPNQAAGPKTFQVFLAGSGAITTTTNIQGSNNYGTSTINGYWVTLGTVILSGTSVVSDGFVSEAPWKWFRAQVVAISGANASVDVIVGEGF